MEITDKKQMYSIFEKGGFGNKPVVWNSEYEFLKSGYKGVVSIRAKGIIGFKTLFCIPTDQVEKIINEAGLDGNMVSITEGLPDNKLLIQGEVMRSFNHIDLTYSTIKKPMKIALAEEEIIEEGLTAKITLQKHLSAASFDDLMELMDLYPDSVIEFSTYEINIGSCRGRNTLIWEVRNY